jgi:hypothetical protein
MWLELLSLLGKITPDGADMKQAHLCCTCGHVLQAAEHQRMEDLLRRGCRVLRDCALLAHARHQVRPRLQANMHQGCPKPQGVSLGHDS